MSPPTITEGPSRSRGGSALYKQQSGEGPPGVRTTAAILGLSLRGMAALIKARLATSVHPNPGPGVRRGRRARTEEGRRARRERRYQRRRNGNGASTREGIERENIRGGGCEIVTWNVQGMSVRENNRNRMRRVVDKIVRERWEVVCLTELRAEGEGVVWLGEDECRVAVVHGKKSGVLLQKGALEAWINEGQKKWMSERVTAVVFAGMRVVSAYQPVWGSDDTGMRDYRRELEIQVAMGGQERLLIGGDFNANVGKRYERQGVCGKYGVGRVNEAGRDLIDWCEEQGLAYVNSFMRHERRGTWFHPRYGRWYELDGFLVRKRERHNMVERMRTRSEWGLSDHRPKLIRLRKAVKKWRTSGQSGKRVPKIRWEVLQDERKKEEYAERTRQLMEEGEWDESVGEWEKVSEVMVRAAKQVCGESERGISNPWVIGNEEEIESLNVRVNEAVNERNDCMNALNDSRNVRMRVRTNARGSRNARIAALEELLVQARTRVRNARKELRIFMRRIERRWWEGMIEECKEACDRGRIGDMYKCMRKLGTRGAKAPASSVSTVAEFKEHFERVSKERYEVDPSVIESVIERVDDLRENERARIENDRLNEMPERDEIERAMKEMKDSSPGEDGVRLRYICSACEEVRVRVIGIVRMMFDRRANEWDECAKSGVIVPLFKKGDRNDVNNYRGVCLLSMCSRVLARVIAKRVSVWAECLGLLDDNQAGFRSGRSTADVVQMMVRMNEDVEDCMRRVSDVNENEWPVARLLDLRKAYPRVNKPALWSLLERYGMNGKCLESLIDLHECTVYKVRGKEGMSESWMPARGLREGCSTSPILFNVYHQAVMRQAEARRHEQGGDVGVPWSWVPGGSFAGGKVWEKGGRECKTVRMSCGLFADDTTIVGMSGEINEGVRAVKSVMNEWEEQNNEAKEEVLEFGTEEGGSVRVLGSWVCASADVKNRIKRANGLWWKVKSWLKGSRLTKRWQGRVIEACVECSLLYDCQVRVWYKRDVKRLQSWIDKCYRFAWSDRKGEPLRQMEEKGVNMQDVRSCLGVKSIRLKIEKRVLERIGHVVRMGNDRLTKAMVFGWYKGLEGKAKMKGMKRKTVLYWKRMLKECGVDWTDIERLCGDRDGWKTCVRERVNHLDKWERQLGHKYVWDAGENPLQRNDRRVLDLECKYDGCGKVCKSKGGLVQHQKRVHRAPLERVRFECGVCGLQCETEVACMNHEKTCGGGSVGLNQRECSECGRWVGKANYARHVRACRARREGGEVNEEASAGASEERRDARGKTAECQRCGKTLSYSNMARHEKSCRVWDPGGGPRP